MLRYKTVTYTVAADNEYFAHVRPELLKMALGNLIKNAFQYTDEGEVTLTIDKDKITISDTGLGIPEALMPQLYERFERLEPPLAEDNISKKVEGTGLGLSIVQRIMTHMDWTLTHETNASGGSTFSIYYS